MFSSVSSIGGENSVAGIKTQQTTTTVLAPPKRAALGGLSLNSGGVKTSSINSSSSSLDVEYCSASSSIHQSILSTSSTTCINSELFGSNNTSVLSLKKLKSVGQRVAASVVSSSHIHLENDDELNSSASLKMTHVTKTKSTKSTLGTSKPSSFAIFEEDLDEGSIIPSSDPSADQGDEWADLINEF